MVRCTPTGQIVLACTLLWLKAAAQTFQEYEARIGEFRGTCLEFNTRSQWWNFDYCIQSTVLQYHKHTDSDKVDSHFVGTYSHRTYSGNTVTEHYGRGERCQLEGGRSVFRSADVVWRCCGTRQREQRTTFIESVTERQPCTYEVRVCSQTFCNAENVAAEPTLASDSIDKEQPPASNQNTYLPQPVEGAAPSPPPARGVQQAATISAIVKQTMEGKDSLQVSEEERLRMLQRVREMFTTAYDGYMRYAFPAGELRPITCRPGNFDLVKTDGVTLIDTLDTLAIMGNGTEFTRAVHEVLKHISFDVDVNVSVFETTIRLLGGLLSAHLFAIDPALALMPQGSYNGELLQLAQDLGDRLMPAFETRTGIPFGTVNLRRGVPPGESEIASTAGAGSLTMEFYVLSELTGNPEYFKAADAAIRALHSRRSDLGLLGKHIHVHSGKWTEHLSGIGSNVDSFFEYLLKMYLMLDDDSYWKMFVSTYLPIRSILQQGDWFADVDMHSGKVRRQRFENLQAYWPGLQVLIGNLRPAKQFLNAFYAVWNEFGFVPEQFDYVQWQLVNDGSLYPLRPELIESTYYMYQATKDESWLRAGVHFLTSIDMDLETACGFASVKNIGTTELTDNMPSFFLSETLKYLYLLFDTDNFVHARPFIFSTEAHPFDVTFINRLSRAKAAQASNSTQTGAKNRSNSSDRVEQQKLHSFNVATAGALAVPTSRLLADDFIPRFCPVVPWFESLEYQPGANPSHKRTSVTELFNDGPDQCAPESQLLLPSSDAQFDPLPNVPSSQVALDVPEVGRFLVDMADGVKITHTNSGETLELHNLGFDFIVLRNTVGSNSKLVMADTTGTVVSCTITPSFSQVPSSVDIPKDFLQPRHCSVAAFGPTASGRDVQPISSNVVLPDDLFGCETTKRSWWSGMSRLENKLVMVKRGQCMFEEKARNAAASGATGVLVTNNDDELFVMAGAKEAGDVLVLPAVEIPTVMVTASDGKLLESFLELARRRKLKPQLTMRVVQHHSALANEIMGLDDWPQVFLQPNLVHIRPAGNWSVWLAATNNLDWRITISASTSSVLQPEFTNYFTGKSASGQLMTVISRGSMNMVQLYNFLGRRVCPAVFTVHGPNHISLR